MKLSEIPPFARGACRVARTEIAAIAALIEADEKANKQGRKPKN